MKDSLKVPLFLLLLVDNLIFGNIPRFDNIDKLLNNLNSQTFKSLESLTRQECYSRIKIPTFGQCKRPTKKCTLISCMLKPQSILDKEYVNLLDVPEANTGYVKNASEAWKNIEDIIEGDKIMSVILSGVRYSVFTHLSAFYKKIFYKYFPNHKLFLKKYNDDYRINFYVTYIVIRESVGKIILNDYSQPDLVDIIESINKEPMFSKLGLKNGDTSFQIKKVDKIIEQLDCIECDKCQLWGRIQFEGLKTGLKILKGSTEITSLEKVYLLNFFMRLSVSVKENIKLRQYSNEYLPLIPLYFEVIASMLIGTLLFFIFFVLKKKNKKGVTDII